MPLLTLQGLFFFSPQQVGDKPFFGHEVSLVHDDQYFENTAHSKKRNFSPFLLSLDLAM